MSPEFSGLPGSMSFWDELERLDPTSPILLILARGYLGRGNPRQALAVARRIQTARPNDIDAILIVAKALAEQGRNEEALVILNQSPLGPESIQRILEETGDLYAAIKEDSMAARYQEAGRIIQDLKPDIGRQEEDTASFEPGKAFVTETMATLYIKQGHLQEAAAIYRQLIEQEPDNPRYRKKLAELGGPPDVLSPAARETFKSRLERLKTAARKRREKVASGSEIGV
jgi:tetratricopeptide (TPR) repeat protein